jgi:hypothetical protein
LTRRRDSEPRGRPRARQLVLAALIVGVGLLAFELTRHEPAAPQRPATEPVNPPPSAIITPTGEARSTKPEEISAAGLAAARRVARRFLDGYLAFLYGRGPASEITDVSPAVGRELARNTPRIPPAQRDRTPRVVDLSVVGQAREAVIATASIDDGDVAVYPIVFTLDRRDGRWRVSRLAND